MTPGAPLLFRKVTVSRPNVSPLPEIVEDCIGEYFPSGEFSCGRQVFKHSDRNEFSIMLKLANVHWYIMKNETKIMRSCVASSMSPGDSKVGRPSTMNPETHWTYKDFNKLWKKCNIVVSCTE